MSKEGKREGEREEGGRETSAECVVYSLFKIFNYSHMMS